MGGNGSFFKCRVEENGGVLALVAHAARTVALVAVFEDFHVDGRIAAVGQRPPYGIHVFRINIFIDRNDIFADGAMLGDKRIHRAPDFHPERILFDVQDHHFADVGQRFVQRNARHAFQSQLAQGMQQ